MAKEKKKKIKTVEEQVVNVDAAAAHSDTDASCKLEE